MSEVAADKAKQWCDRADAADERATGVSNRHAKETVDDDADEVLESIEDLLEQGDEQGIQVIVVPHE